MFFSLKTTTPLENDDAVSPRTTLKPLTDII
jgi:hypothetical protein